jgi:hypothetical protein
LHAFFLFSVFQHAVNGSLGIVQMPFAEQVGIKQDERMVFLLIRQD